MTTLKDKIIEAGFADHILSDIDLHNLLGGTSAARYGMVNKAIKQAELIKIRRGLYLLADKYRRKKMSQFYLASRVTSHSYISLESALSYYGWIPERTSVVSSVISHARTKQFVTVFGEFSYYYLPINEYEFLTGVSRIEEIENEPFLLASPLRALADLIYIKKMDWQGLGLLTNGLRIDIDQLMQVDSQHFSEIKNVYRASRVLYFLEKLKKELQK